MSKQLNIAFKKHLWKFYVKLSNFEAQCMFCENKYPYLQNENFEKHIAIQHRKIWIYEKDKKLTRWPWRYFKYLDNIYLQCIICDANVLSTTESVENHLSLHSLQQLEDNIYRSWTWKYWTRRDADDFIIECNICHKNLSLSINPSIYHHIKKIHLDKLKNMQEIHDIVGLSKRDVLSLQTNTMSSSLNIATMEKKHLWKYYVKLEHFQAQCMFCKNKYKYINIINFKMHIAKQHDTIWKYEEERHIIWSWRYFKYINKLHSQCIICDAHVLSTTESAENHLSLHSKDQQKNYKYCSWPWKYCAKKDDFVMECNVCNKKISVVISNYVLNHIKKKHPDKVKNTQETHDTAGSSESVLLFQMDTSMSLNIATKEHVWKYYVKLPDFQAQCVFCKNEYTYINCGDFQKHIARHHENIWKYEEKRKLIKWPWMHFKYLSNIYLQCIICNANVPFTSECVENHLNSHSTQQQENYKYCSWPRKYCTQKDDFKVECNVCNNTITLSIERHLHFHIKKHSDKLKNAQETYDIVDPSKYISSLETDTTCKLILSLKDCYVLLKKCPHYDLYM